MVTRVEGSAATLKQSPALIHLWEYKILSGDTTTRRETSVLPFRGAKRRNAPVKAVSCYMKHTAVLWSMRHPSLPLWWQSGGSTLHWFWWLKHQYSSSEVLVRWWNTSGRACFMCQFHLECWCQPPMRGHLFPISLSRYIHFERGFEGEVALLWS